MPVKFNPLDKFNLGESVANAVLAQPIKPLGGLEKFDGAGVYAIYYVGPYKPYALLSQQNQKNQWKKPIYVGKAVPTGARKGGFGLDIDPGKALYKRLREHAGSVRTVNNLDIKDFHCRYLVTDDIWIPLGEALLIETYKPLWNSLVAGFGIHTPGKGRKKQRRSLWDTLHHGRKFATKLPTNPKSSKQILKLVGDFLAGKEVPIIPVDEAVMEEDAAED